MADVGGINGERLRSFIERIERLEEQKSALAADIRELFAEAKGAGFDSKIMKQVIRLRKLDARDRQEKDMLLDLYLRALGMLEAGESAGYASGGYAEAGHREAGHREAAE